jgi:hypothetical protein
MFDTKRYQMETIKKMMMNFEDKLKQIIAFA